MEEFFKGLSVEDAALAADDLMHFGAAFTLESDGNKRRIAPGTVFIGDAPDGTQVLTRIK